MRALLLSKKCTTLAGSALAATASDIDLSAVKHSPNLSSALRPSDELWQNTTNRQTTLHTWLVCNALLILLKMQKQKKKKINENLETERLVRTLQYQSSRSALASHANTVPNAFPQQP
jgi:hypothetical protein